MELSQILFLLLYLKVKNVEKRIEGHAADRATWPRLSLVGKARKAAVEKGCNRHQYRWARDQSRHQTTTDSKASLQIITSS